MNDRGTIHKSGTNHGTPPGDLKAEFAAHRDDEGDPSAPYVSSKRLRISWGIMTPEQTEFYKGWRTALRRGEHPDSDEGYAWLYLSELINSDDDPEEVLARLQDFGKSYRFGDFGHNPTVDLIADWIIEHDLRIPGNQYGGPGGYLMWLRFQRKPMETVNPHDMAWMSDHHWYKTYEMDGFFEDVMNGVLRWVDADRESKGKKRLADMGIKSSASQRLYQGYYRPDLAKQKWEYRDMYGSVKLQDIFADVCWSTEDAVRAVRKGEEFKAGSELDEVAYGIAKRILEEKGTTGYPTDGDTEFCID